MEFSSAISMEKYATNRSLMHSIQFLLPQRKINDYLCRKARIVGLLIVGESARAGKRLRAKSALVLHGNTTIELVLINSKNLPAPLFPVRNSQDLEGSRWYVRPEREGRAGKLPGYLTNGSDLQWS